MIRGAGGDAAAERRRLCLAFADLVAERGCRDVAASSVVERAGAPPGAFQRHFGDMSECFMAAWDELEAAYLGQLELTYRVQREWRDKLRAGLLETARLAEANPGRARFLAVETLAFGTPGRERQNVLGRRLTELLDTARRHADRPDAAPAVTARWIAGIFFDRIYRRFASPGGPDLVSQVPELMFLAVSAYFGVQAGLAELKRAP